MPADPIAAAPRSAVHSASLFLVWLAVFAGFFVAFEPAPADALMLGLIVLLPVVGLTAINGGHLAYLVLWLVVMGAGFVATGNALEPGTAAAHMAVSLYLCLFSFVIAAFVAKRPEAHARLVFRAYAAGAVVAALMGIAGYFDAVADARALFTVHQRAAGTFKDPNVFAQFLVPPLLYLLHEALTRRALKALLPVAAAAVIGLALLLSLSRGAWIAFAIGLAIYVVLAFVTARTDRQRVKLVSLVFGLLALGVVLLAAALESDTFARLFSERATVTQSYDEGPEGRFGGQVKAWRLILDHPFGLGALQFGGIHHPEHPHNVYLSQFLNGGWIGGLAYIVLVAVSLMWGLCALRRRQWPSRLLLVVLAAFAGLAFEGFVIESDHWRNFYLVLGVLWGLVFPSLQAASSATARRPARLIAPLPASLASLPLCAPRRVPRLLGTAQPVAGPIVVRRPKTRRREPRRKARLVLH